eukprot:TRINITY_DN39778_c0_g1_i1.p1 TRINITY_DN39778_c0_g1~~TRINITY_DN39778_c0_g1_i1.p1  ORF type:complete len:327 (+),score=84.80 TRINITY_DN39778_c0_g1_i1:64-981(+)
MRCGRCLSRALPATARRFASASAQHLDMNKWLVDNLPTLKPPVANKLVYGNSGATKIMAVGGPNERTDFHMQTGEEFFLQLRGTAWLDVVEGGVYKKVPIPEDHAFLLPSRVWHSPQRTANSAGIVIERGHLEAEMDGLRWHQGDIRYGSPQGPVDYEEYFHCYDLGASFGPIFRRWQQHVAAEAAPVVEQAPPLKQDDTVSMGPVVDMRKWRESAGVHSLFEGSEVMARVHCGGDAPIQAPAGVDSWVFVYRGEATLASSCGAEATRLRQGDSVLLSKGSDPEAGLSCTPGSAVITVWNSNATM